MKQLFLLPNGNTAYFDDGQQQEKVQKKSWLVLQLEYLEKCGVDPREIDEIHLPDRGRVKPFKTSEGRWNWEIV